MAKRTRKPRGLVIGHLERISSTAFDTFSREITELVGGRHGIYALYRNNRLHYVGLASNLRTRIKQHLRDRHAGRWNYFSLYLVRSERHLHDLESLAIRVAYPKGNKTRGKFGGAPDLRKLLRKRMTARMKEDIDKIFKGTDTEAKKPTRTRGRTKAKKKARGRPNIPLKGLLAGKRLRGTHKGKTFKAWVYASGRIRLTHTGEIFDTPSGAAKAILKRPVTGWQWWRYKGKNGQWTRLADLRK